MLFRENRLILGRDFNVAYREGRFLSSGNISLKVRENGLEKTRIGFSIGLNFSNKAVDRNKAKRWLREIAKKQLKNIGKSVDMVVMLKKEPTFPTYQALESNFQKALSRGDLIIK
ncbi:MAG: ribonuclease P protein component [Parcubacteria group bacterium]